MYHVVPSPLDRQGHLWLAKFKSKNDVSRVAGTEVPVAVKAKSNFVFSYNDRSFFSQVSTAILFPSSF